MLVLTLASQAVFPPSKHKSGVFSWYTVLASFCHTSRMQLSYQHETRTDMLLCSLPSSSISDPERALYLVLMVLRDFKANSNLANLLLLIQVENQSFFTRTVCSLCCAILQTATLTHDNSTISLSQQVCS